MTKRCVLSFLIATSILISCENEPEKHETETSGNQDNREATITNLGDFLNGWEITKIKYDFESFDINCRDLFFINPEIGFVVGYNGVIYKTINSGKSWKKQNSGTTAHFFSVYFINESVGFASADAMDEGCLNEDCGKGCVFLKTIDGGETWTKNFFKDYIRIRSLYFFNESTGLALVNYNSIYYYIAKTENGGDSWKIINPTIKTPHENFFYVDNIVYLAGERQEIYKSTDWGDNWETLTTPIPAWNNVRNLYFYNENIGFIDGVTYIYKTTDGGKNWTTVDLPFSTLGTFHLYSESEWFKFESVYVYEFGDFPTFKGSQSYHTYDGGKTWDNSGLIDSVYIGLAYFPQRDLGYAYNGSEFHVIKKKQK